MPREARVRSELVLTDFLTGLARRLQVVDAVRAARAALLAAAGAILGTAALGYRSSSVWVAVALAAAATGMAMLWRARERWSPGAVASLFSLAVLGCPLTQVGGDFLFIKLEKAAASRLCGLLLLFLMFSLVLGDEIPASELVISAPSGTFGGWSRTP